MLVEEDTPIDWQGAAERHMETIGRLERELSVVRHLLARATFDHAPGWRSDACAYLALHGLED